MDRNNHIDELEEFLRDKSDVHKLFPSEKTWNNIQRDLHGRPKWPYAVLTLILMIGSAVFLQQQQISQPLGIALVEDTAVNVQRLLSFSPPLQWSNTKSLAEKGSAVIDASQVSVFHNTVAQSSYAVNGYTSAAPSPNAIGQEVAITEQVFDYEENLVHAWKTGKQQNRNETQRHFSTIVVDHSDKGEDQEYVEERKLWGGEPFKKRKISWMASISPTISYRRLTGGINDANNIFKPVTENNDILNLVAFRPAVGAEAAINLAYRANRHVQFKAGLQLNYSRYQVSGLEKAFADMQDPENIQTIHKSYDGPGAIWLNNEYMHISLPVGVEAGILGKGKFRWHVAGSIMPTYNVSSNLFVLDHKDQYSSNPSLIRRWNVAAGVETFVAYNMGKYRWQAGPQLRYQLLSSYQSNHPVKEYLVDFGFKVGISRTLR